MTTTVAAHRLAEALTQVMPHMADPTSSTPILASVRLANDGTHLHAVATDRYTLAVARQRPHACEDEWTATVGAVHAAYLQAWAASHPGHHDTVDLAVEPGLLTASSTAGRITVPTLDGAHVPWRGLLATHLGRPAEPVDLTTLDTQYLARWAQAGRHLQITQAAPEAPLVLTGAGFIGLQMPVRRVLQNTPSRAELAADWAAPTGHSTADDVDLPMPADGDAAPAMTEDLLKHVLMSTQELYDVVGGEDHAATAAHARAGSHAWTAYRLLQVLRVIDPRTTELALADIASELEDGDFAERAFDDAETLGHQPQAWIDSYITARAARAEQAHDARRDTPAPDHTATHPTAQEA
ncbi:MULTISPECIES: hypothetical protein [Streptomycetaceae]|uniref:hypothetical protein n=1 Tax=Streptomycetaceae TaxID=2062 RepID=UPI00093FC779|nr:hypothetical protein [Streptomyces sp. CB02056]OKH97520.1 hypothetical protein AMK13_38045 [Streptomyces sp. CB02056]